MRLRLSRRRTVVVASAAAVVVIGAAAVAWALSGGGSTAAPKQTAFTVRTGTVTVTASASGTVEPIDSRALTFGVGGTVSTLSVKAGDHVTAGETLATLDPSDAETAVSSAQSALDAADSNLTQAESQPTATPTQTACVTGADFVLGAPSPSPSASPTPTPTPSPSASISPRPSGSRHPSPSSSGGQGCGSGSGSGGGSGGGSGRGGTNQSTGTDPLMRAQQAVNNAELALEQAEAQLAGTTIISPTDGRVLSVGGSVGQSVSSGGSGFIVIGGFNSLAVEAQFSEADVAAVAIGQKATVTLADHPGTTYDATVTEVDPAGTTSGQLVRYGVQLEFTDPPSDLLLGQSAVAAVVTASASNVLYVPTAALSDLSGNRATVTVRTGTGDVSRQVSIGLSGDQGTQITSGLNTGEVVVVSTS
jgi:HlyD family secretion protein